MQGSLNTAGLSPCFTLVQLACHDHQQQPEHETQLTNALCPLRTSLELATALPLTIG